jgi:hypothetical protein
MRPVQTLAFAQKTITPSRGESTEISGGLVKRITLNTYGTFDTGATPSTNKAGAVALLGDIKLTQDGSVVASALAFDWYQAFEVFLGGATDQVDTETASSTGLNIAGTLDLDFGRVMKGAGLDASGQHRVGYRVESLPASSYTTNGVTYSLRLDATIEHDGGVASGPYLLPRTQYKVVDAGAASPALYDEFTAPSDGFLLGVQIRTRDASAILRAQGVDGLLKRLKVKHVATDGTGTSELFDGTWRQVRNMTRARWRVPSSKITGLGVIDDGLEAGLAIFPTFDPTAPSGAMRMRKNEKIQIYMDTTSTVENGYTSVTPAAGDQIFLTFHYFAPVGSGSADRAQRGVAPTAALNQRAAVAAINGGRRGRRAGGR